MAKKTIDIQLVTIESDVANAPVQMESVLVALDNFKKESNNKSYQVKLWNNGANSDFVSGIVITEQIKDLLLFISRSFYVSNVIFQTFLLW